MTTALNIVKLSLKMLSVLGRGESLNAEESADALQVLNNMLGSWSAEGGLVFHNTNETFNVNGAASYTIGTGADFNTSRPMRIVSAYISDGNADTPLERMDVSQYNDVADKDLTGRSYAYYYDANFPEGRIYFYPIPSGAYTVTLFMVKRLTEFAALNTPYSFPPEYQDAIVKNLMINLAPYYSIEPTPNQIRLARDAKSVILTSVGANENNEASQDPALTQYYDGLFNFYTGRYE